MIAGIGQVIHHWRKIFAQLLGVVFRAVDHFFQIANLLSELLLGFGCGCIRQPLGFPLPLKRGPFGAGINLGDFFPEALALSIQLLRGARCGTQELLLCFLNGFFKLD